MRLSVTELDAYRRFRALEEMSFEEMLQILLKQRAPTRAMEAGRAFHAVLEDAQPCDLTVIERDGFKFRFNLDCEIALPRVRELKGEIVLPTSVGPVTLVGIVDGIDSGIHDYKLTGRFDAERYFDSYQWRCYLHMFGGSKFVYDVFEGKDEGDEWVIFNYHPLSMYAYPGMAEDVLLEVDELARFTAERVPERAAA